MKDMNEIYMKLRCFEDFEEHRWFWCDYLVDNKLSENELIELFKDVNINLYIEEYKLEHFGLEVIPEANPLIEALISNNHEHKYMDEYTEIYTRFNTQIMESVNKIEFGCTYPIEMLRRYRDIINWSYQTQFITMEGIRYYDDEYYNKIFDEFKDEIFYNENWVAYQTEYLFIYALHLGVNFTVHNLRKMLYLEDTVLRRSKDLLIMIRNYLVNDILDLKTLNTLTRGEFTDSLEIENMKSVLDNIKSDEEFMLYIRLI